MSKILRWLAIGVLMLPLAVPPLRADEAQETADEASAAQPPAPQPLEEYIEVRTPYAPESNTIATKLPVPLNLTPANVGVVSGPLIAEQDDFYLGDALHNISGVNTQAGSGVHDYFLIRGFNSLDGGLILTDGAAEPEVSYYPLYNVDGVELLKGPGGFLYGRNPLAGTVNMIRKQPLPGNFAVFGASVGSFDTYEATVDWNLAGADDRRSFRLNGLWQDSDHYRDDKDSRHVAVNPSFTLRWGESSRLNFNVEYVDAQYSPDSGLPLVDGRLPDVDRKTSYQSPFDDSQQTIGRFQIDYEKRLADNVSLRNKTFYRSLDWRTAGTLLVQTVPLPPEFGGTQVVRSMTDLDDDQQYLGNQFEAVLRLGSNVTHQLLAGVELSRYDDDFGFGIVPPCQPGVVEPPYCISTISLDAPVETADSVVALPYLLGDEKNTVIAPYVTDQIRFSERFQLMLGLRYDVIDVEVDYALNPWNPASTGYDRTHRELSPMAGAVYAPSQSLSLYANAGRSFAPLGARVAEADTLDPEDSVQFELGAKKRFLGDRIRTTFAVYRIDRENIPISDDNGVTQQTGDQRSQGFEFELAAEPRPRFRVFFAYAYNDAELTHFVERVPPAPTPEFGVFDRSGNRPAFTPEHLASLWLSRSFASGWGVGGGLRYVSEQYIAEDNLFAIDSYLLLDAAVFYDFEMFRLKLNLKNLTDQDYEQRGFGSSSVIPADPFAVYASVECRL